MMEVCRNNNNNANQYTWDSCSEHDPSPSRPKRDFRIQVCEVRQGPKWFIWPSRNGGSTEEVDENHNKEAKTVTENTTHRDHGYPSPNQFVTYGSSQNGYGAMRRTVLRSSKRKPLEGSDAPSRTLSEPAPRRISLKKEKASTEPINGPSNTFKILSVSKKWESFDATDDEADVLCCSCQTLCPADTERRRTTTN